MEDYYYDTIYEDMINNAIGGDELNYIEDHPYLKTKVFVIYERWIEEGRPEDKLGEEINDMVQMQDDYGDWCEDNVVMG